jgi:hypothetical protein
MKNRIYRLAGLVGLQLVIVSNNSCINQGTAISSSDFVYSAYKPKILNEIKKNFDSKYIIEELKLDSSANIEDFKSYWINMIKELKKSDSMDYEFYYGALKTKYDEQKELDKYPDSVRLIKSELGTIKEKLDSARQGLYGNLVLAQFERLSKETGGIYLFNVKLRLKDSSKPLSVYYGVEALEKDTTLYFTTNSSLFHFMTSAYLRRNVSFWTKYPNPQQLR